MSVITDEDLLRYLDGSLSVPERLRLEYQLLSDASARLRIELLGAALQESGWPVVNTY